MGLTGLMDLMDVSRSKPPLSVTIKGQRRGKRKSQKAAKDRLGAVNG